MTYLKLRDIKTGQIHEFDGELVRVGREPGQELVFTGDLARVVSGHHAQFTFLSGAWSVEDLGSSNGTMVDEKRIPAGTLVPVDAGHTIGFGGGGPKLVIDAVSKRATPKTVIERSGSRPHGRQSAPTERMAGLADVTAPPQPAVPRGDPPQNPDKPRVRLSAPTERMRGVDADAAVAAAHAAHHASPAAPAPKPHDGALPPPLPPPPPRASIPVDQAPPRAATPAPTPPPPAPKARVAPPASAAPPQGATTVAPAADVHSSSPSHDARSAAPTASLILRELRNNQTFTVRGGRIRIGRGDECELRPVSSGDTSVSRVHAEIVLRPEGGVVVRDSGSRNGTLVNGQRVTTEVLVYRGDVILLGEGGPELKIEELSGPGVAAAPPRVQTPLGLVGRRSFGGKGATAFMRELVTETASKSSGKLRWVIWSFVIVLVILVVAGWFFLQAQAEQTSAAFAAERARFSAAQAQADSVRQASEAETARLLHAMDSARSGSASSAVLDSIRRQLTEQQQRTANLDSSLHRAQADLSKQRTVADSQRAGAARDLQHVQSQLEHAQQNTGGASNAQVAALQHLVDSVSQRYSQLGNAVRALKGTDLG
ncbi:MAG TPA: FHA domain-containing protein, partial [Gemmatimonadales bacterium]